MIDSYFDDKYKGLEIARSRQDANAYFRFCQELNVPEIERDQYLYEQGEASITFLKIQKVDFRKKKDSDLIKAVDDAGLNFSNPKSRLDLKIKIHKDILGNQRLRIDRDNYLAIEHCKPERINSALRDAYNTAKKRRG